MQWEAQFPSSQTSTAELCYLDGVLVRLRETPTHHLQEAVMSVLATALRVAGSHRPRSRAKAAEMAAYAH